jgi:hypothetical protein
VAASTDATTNIMGEPEVILGHPSLITPRNISLDEEMGMAHWAITQVQGVLHREHGSIDKEHQLLLLWASLLKEQTTSERARAVVR